jgi:Cu/Ag efflux pump CusA
LPGEGSVIYRGLATAIVGGMTFSLFFTLLMLPSLLRIGAATHAAVDPAVDALPQRGLESVA